MARWIQSTTNSLIALAVGRRQNLALRPRKKNESLLEKSGFRPFQNATKSTTIWGSKIRFQLMSSIHRDNSFGKGSNMDELDQMNDSASARESDERPSDIRKTGENSLPQNRENQQFPEQKDSMDLTVTVHLEMKGDGEHVLKIKGFGPSSTEEDNVEREKQMAQKAAVLLLYGEMLQEMGKKWRAQFQASDSSE
ncbi:hypothetical protein JHK87_001401 [Glycine soja]|nr:hypothetical protein JHK87_001401 [Glycine soja]